MKALTGLGMTVVDLLSDADAVAVPLKASANETVRAQDVNV